MREPRGPSQIPSLIPFVVLAVILLVIYGGVLLFPAIKGYIERQDCLGSGRTDCEARS